LSGVLLMDFQGHICTVNTDMYCATLKSLCEVLTILATVQCSSMTMPLAHSKADSHCVVAFSMRNNGPSHINSRFGTWQMFTVSHLHEARATSFYQ